MTKVQKIVLLAAGALFLVWLIGNASRMVAEDEGFIRFVLGLLFSALILLRWKPVDKGGKLPMWTVLAAGCGGALLAVLGTVFRVHQFEWLGLILVLYACLGWALPARFSRDIVLALLLLYWVHPLPGQVFGRFQILMQMLSVKVSEWALHGLNVRVWADGMVLHTAGNAFGVPESCSGMRAAVTVFLCTLGAGVLLRLRWYELPAFLVIGVLQVLLLNVVRIAAMVIWAPRMPEGWAETFLHDTLGIFLLVSILLIQVEISVWKFWIEKRRRIRQGIHAGELEPPDLGTVLPGFWRRLTRWGWKIVGVLLLAAFTVLALYKSREAHRMEMIRGAVRGIAQSNPEVAERVIARVLAFDPDDREMRTQLVRVLLERKKFEAALDEIGRLKGELSTLETVWKAWALMALDRIEEAMAAIDALPERTKRVPGVAIIRAEFAAKKDLPEEVARNIAFAAVWPVLAERVRMLFPYLAAREQWAAIAACDSHVPFSSIEHALLAVAANLRVSDVAGAEGMLRLGLDRWPLDPRFLRYLGWVALNRRDKDWEARLAASFAANILDLSPDVLADYLGTCFRLQRPDLAWLAYLRLQEMDERDPALSLAVAQFGDVWFTFRRRDLHLPPATDSDTVDLAAVSSVTEHLPGFSNLWVTIPLRRELAGSDTERIKREQLAQCLAELERRHREGDTSYRVQFMYPFVLSLAGRYDDAHAALKPLMERWPKRRAEILLQQATLYTQEARWAEAYETLREYAAESGEPSLSAALMKVQALMNLNMGIAALDTMAHTRRLFPHSPRLEMAEVAIWDAFGFKDHAVFLLRKAGLEQESRGAPQLLYDAGYVDEAVTLSKAMGVRILEGDRRAGRMLAHPRAERSITPQFPAPLTEAELAREAAAEEENGQRAASPLIGALSSGAARWYRNAGREEAGLVEAWSGIGRDDSEKATALHRLALLAGRQGQTNLAVRAITEALRRRPESAILHRMLIGLAQGDREAVAQARRACPADPEIWLAFLVTRVQDGASAEWAAAEIEAGITADVMPPSAIVRAGSFLLDKGMVEPAARAARHAIDRGRGTLPAYVLGLRCALALRDWDWAVGMALRCAEKADEPAPFYRTVVDIKTMQKKKDGDMISALRFLQAHFPDDSIWAERLGLFYFFEERDMKRALSMFAPVLSENSRNVRLQSLLLASEAARQQGDLAQAVGILETARTLYPDDVVVLNNLVYCLALSPDTLKRARTLLGELLEKGGASFSVLDTAATVYLNSGELRLAKEYIDKAMTSLSQEDYSALEAQLNHAKVLFRLGQLSEAKRIATAVGRDPKRGFVVEKEAAQLLLEIEKAERSKGNG